MELHELVKETIAAHPLRAQYTQESDNGTRIYVLIDDETVRVIDANMQIVEEYESQAPYGLPATASVQEFIDRRSHARLLRGQQASYDEAEERHRHGSNTVSGSSLPVLRAPGAR